MVVCSAWPKFELHTTEYLDGRLILQYRESSWKWNLNTQNSINCSMSHLQPVSSPCVWLCCISSTVTWPMQLSFFAAYNRHAFCWWFASFKYGETGFCDKLLFLYMNMLYSVIQKTDIVKI